MRSAPLRVLRNQRKAVVRAAAAGGPERFGTGIFREGLTVYRFFKEARHADALVAGRVWISTLDTCRTYEATAQSDNAPGLVVGGDPRFGGVARDGAPVGRSVESDGADAYVLCTTERRDGTEDEHCVEILLPHLLRLALQSRLRARRADFLGCDVGRVIYNDGHAPHGLAKAPDRYRPLQEIRFLYRVENPVRLKPFLLLVPEAVGLCRRLS